MAAPKIRPVQVGDRTRYRFVVDIGRDPVTGKRRQLTRTYDRKGEAQRELAKLLHEVNRGSYAAPTKTTVDAYLGEWLRSATRGKEAATVRNYADALRPVRARLGAVELQKLTTKHIEDLVDWMETEGRRRGGKPGTPLSPRTVQLSLSRLRSALDAAVRHRYVEVNVATPVRPPSQEKTERKPWSVDEVRAFLAGLSGDRMEAPLLLSLLGLRPAEVCGLRWTDVNLNKETLTIANTRTLVATDEGMTVVEKPPKTAAGARTLPLPRQAVAALGRLSAMQAAEKLVAGPAYTSTEYVLVDEVGQPCRTDWFRRRAHAAMKAIGVRKVRLYDARHACLTYLAKNGVPDFIVAKWAGHADGGVTAKRYYIHADDPDLDKPRDALTALFG